MDTSLGFVREHWHTFWGLVAGCLVAVALATLVIPATPLLPRITAAGLGVAFVAGAWWVSRQPPKTRPGKIGFAICLETSAGSTSASRTLRDYFTRTVQGLMQRGEMAQHLEVLVVPDYLTRTVFNLETADGLRKRMRAHFVLYGSVVLGNHFGKPTHFLRMNGLVAHTELQPAAKEQLTTEFSELLPQKVNIDMANDLSGFEFISGWTEVSAKYVVALAAAMSGALGASATLFRDVSKEIVDLPANVPPIAKIRERAPKRLAQVNSARAAVVHRLWVRDKDPARLTLLGEIVEEIPDELLADSGGWATKAIWVFLGKDDAPAALKIVETNNCEGLPAWHFSRAFLCAYLGDFKRANHEYLRLSQMDIDPDTLTQVEEFLYWVLSQKPDRFHIYFCLGAIAWRIRGDAAVASKEFSEFLVRCPSSSEFARTREVVQGWLKQIELLGGTDV